MPAHRLSLITSWPVDGVRVAPKHLGRLRSQVAVVRALADEVDRLSRAGDADAPGDQLVEEMARLGCRLLETAGTLAEAQPAEDSVVVALRSPSTTRA
jgi:type II secretory pathway component PulM